MFDFLLGNDFLSAVIAFALVLIPAIIVHEFGHFLAARLIGVNVLEFGVGFPPRVVRLFRWKETDFTLNLLPIGGFVRPLGEDMIGPVDEKSGATNLVYPSDRDELRARGVRDEDMLSVNEAKPLPRILFLAGGALANFVSAIVLFIIIALIGIPQIVGARAQILSVPEGSALAQAGIKAGDILESVDGQYFSTINDLSPLLQTSNTQQREITLIDGETLQVRTVALTDYADDLRGGVRVLAVAEASPAEEAGLIAGDIITAIKGEPIAADDPVTVIQLEASSSAGQPLLLTVLRGDESLETSLTPRDNPPPGEGRIGIGIEAVYPTASGVIWREGPAIEQIVSLPIPDAISFGLNRTSEIFQIILALPGRLIEGSISAEEARPVSVVGISQVGGQLLQQSVEQGTPVIILNFIALVSLFLGISNLLPFPPLDGGRIVFVIVEMARGKAVSAHVEGMIYRFGIVFLLSLVALIMLYDIFNPFVLPQ